MSITFPRTLPTGIRGADFDLKYYTESSGGGAPVIESRPAVWMAKYETRPLNALQLRTWRAWWNSLRGGVNLFYAYDPKFPYPYNYPSGFTGLVRAGGSTPFDGTAATSSPAATTLTVTTLPNAFVLTAGDYIGLQKGNYRSLHRILESATANSSGVVALTVEPPIETVYFNGSVTVNFDRPVVKMRIDPKSWTNPTGLEDESLSFSAEQVGF